VGLRLLVGLRVSLLSGTGGVGPRWTWLASSTPRERVQDRLDRYLIEPVDELCHAPREVVYGDGVPV